MNSRRSFLRSLLCAVVLAPFAWRRKPEEFRHYNFGYFIRQSDEPHCFGVEAEIGHAVSVYSPRQKHTWIVPSGETWPFCNSEDLYIYGGSHRFVSGEEMIERNEEYYRNLYSRRV